MTASTRGRDRVFFAFFLVSGACSLVYEVIWLRLAMAAFGVTAPLVSIVLSVFMAGLALGSWGGGRLARSRSAGAEVRALRLYALAELLIGSSGLLVARELQWGHRALGSLGAGAEWGSSGHYLAAGFFVALALLPFCTAMGATFPLAIGALRGGRAGAASSPFSYLYLANVIGAASGTIVSALFLIELLGFRNTLLVAAGMNVVLALAAFGLSLRPGFAPGPADPPAEEGPASRPLRDRDGGPVRFIPWLLFTTGLLSMAMEVVWVRQFTPFLGTVVYSFAAILAVYLVATFLGSAWYRRRALRRQEAAGGAVPARALFLAALLCLLPLLFADPRLAPPTSFTAGIARIAAALGPFCFAIGYLTPMLVDRWSGDDPAKAGSAYALNVLGCILGPLAASFVLLPAMSERWSLAVLSVPLTAFGLLSGAGSPQPGPPAPGGSSRPSPGRARPRPWGSSAACLGATLLIVLLARDFESSFPQREVRRDYSATVIATGRGMRKQLLVNGYGMTVLTPITKMMAHLPLALRESPPRNALVICLGMGTSFRSSLSWGIPVTAVELIPSVPALFGYYHADADAVLARPGARIVVDDGRRFLERTRDRFDVITVDPPPPVEAAGSSLLYSEEFFAAARARLAPGGIMQQWLPTAEPIVVSSVARAITRVFPHVRVFVSEEGWGIHILASDSPIPRVEAATLASRLPPAAAADLVEWQPRTLPAEHFSAVLRQELPLSRLLDLVPDSRPLQDDRPVNEYYFLRRSLAPQAPSVR